MSSVLCVAVFPAHEDRALARRLMCHKRRVSQLYEVRQVSGAIDLRTAGHLESRQMHEHGEVSSGAANLCAARHFKFY